MLRKCLQSWTEKMSSLSFHHFVYKHHECLVHPLSPHASSLPLVIFPLLLGISLPFFPSSFFPFHSLSSPCSSAALSNSLKERHTSQGNFYLCVSSLLYANTGYNVLCNGTHSKNKPIFLVNWLNLGWCLLLLFGIFAA